MGTPASSALGMTDSRAAAHFQGLGLEGGFGQVVAGVVEVVVGVEADEVEVGGEEGAADLAGDSGDEGVGGDAGALGDEGSGGDDGAGADVGSVEDDGADADEDVVFESAAVDGGVVADGAAVSDDDRVEVALAVEDGAVLDVGAGADADAVDVAAEDGVHPDGGLGSEVDVANDLGGGVDVAAGCDGGGEAAEGAKHGDKYRSCADGGRLRGPARAAGVGVGGVGDGFWLEVGYLPSVRDDTLKAKVSGGGEGFCEICSIFGVRKRERGDMLSR